MNIVDELEEYTRHKENCNSNCNPDLVKSVLCNCGLRDLINNIAILSEQNEDSTDNVSLSNLVRQLPQLFKNKSDCYADIVTEDTPFQAMTESRFVEVVTEILKRQSA
jgi:hypothetical protein